MNVKEFLELTQEYKEDGYVELNLLDEEGKGIEYYFGIESFDEMWEDEKNATIVSIGKSEFGYLLCVKEVVYSRRIDGERCPASLKNEERYVKEHIGYFNHSINGLKDIFGSKKVDSWRRQYIKELNSEKGLVNFY